MPSLTTVRASDVKILILMGLQWKKRSKSNGLIKIDFFICHTSIFGCWYWEFTLVFETGQKSPVRAYSGIQGFKLAEGDAIDDSLAPIGFRGEKVLKIEVTSSPVSSSFLKSS